MSNPSYSFYCDESTHLEHDGMPFLVLGAIRCPTNKVHEVAVRLREFKVRHGYSRYAEAKWTRVSPNNVDYYRDIVDYFFDDDDLGFRTVVATKSGLDHEAFGQTHDIWYHKVFYQLLIRVLVPRVKNYVYLDIKDTRSADKIRHLHDILANSQFDFERQSIARVQTIRSHESELMQVADVLIGAVNYANRRLDTSAAKLTILERIRQRSKYSLLWNTALSEEKFNVFHWTPRSR